MDNQITIEIVSLKQINKDMSEAVVKWHGKRIKIHLNSSVKCYVHFNEPLDVVDCVKLLKHYEENGQCIVPK